LHSGRFTDSSLRVWSTEIALSERLKYAKEYVLDTSPHTIASGHAYNTIDEMTRKAAQIGLPAIAFTEHTPKMPGSCGKLYFSNFKVLPREKFGVRRLFGCEANIMDYDGTLDMPDTLLEKMDICY